MALQKISAEDRKALNTAAQQAKREQQLFGRTLPGTLRMGRLAASKIQRASR